MRWKFFQILCGVLLILGGAFLFLAWRAEWFFHVVAKKDFLWPTDSPRPYRLTAEIRRSYPWQDLRSLWRQSPGVYMRYECRIRDKDDDNIPTSSFWVFADHPQPSVYSISPKGVETDTPQVVFDLSGEVLRCEFSTSTHYCWSNDGDLLWHPPKRR